MPDIKQIFLESCQNGWSDEVELYLERGVSPNTIDEFGITALMLACSRKDNIHTVQLLLDNGANVHYKDENGKTAFDYAVKYQNNEIVHLFISRFPEFASRADQVQNQDPTQKFQSVSIQTTEEALKIRELETIIRLCDELKGMSTELNPIIYLKKANALHQLNRKEEALKVLSIAKSIFEETYGSPNETRNWKKETTQLYLQLISLQTHIYTQEPHRIMWLLNEAYQLIEEPEQRYEMRQKRDEAYKKFIQEAVFLRNFIYIEDELPVFEPARITPILTEHIGNVHFVGTTPQKGSIYVAHPYLKNHYLATQEAQKQLFNEQLSELVWLLQNLGATEISLQYNQEGDIRKSLKDPAAELLPDDVGTKDGFLATKQTFQPTQKPLIPNDLVWYNHRPEWQKIVQQRMQGAMSQAEILVLSQNFWAFQEEDLTELEEELQELLDTGYKIKTTNPKDKSRKPRKTAKNDEKAHFSLAKLYQGGFQCKVFVSFAPLKSLIDEPQNPFNVAEEVAKNKKSDKNIPEREMPADTTSILPLAVEPNPVLEPFGEKVEQALEEIKEIIFDKEPVSVKEVVKTAYDEWVEQKRDANTELPEEIQRIKEKVEPKRDKSSLFEDKTDEIKVQNTVNDTANQEIIYKNPLQELPQQESENETSKINLQKVEEPEPILIDEIKSNLKEVSEDTKVPEAVIEPATPEAKPEKVIEKPILDADGFTQEERYYYDMLQHAYQDDGISENVRKVLERRRLLFQISEERSLEIEQKMLLQKEKN